MTKIVTDVSFAFDILTPAGDLIAEDIGFTAKLTGSYCRAEPDVGINYPWFEDLEFTNIEVEATSYDPTIQRRGRAHSVPLPDDLKPAFERWAEDTMTDTRCQEWLHEAMRDNYDG